MEPFGILLNCFSFGWIHQIHIDYELNEQFKLINYCVILMLDKYFLKFLIEVWALGLISNYGIKGK